MCLGVPGRILEIHETDGRRMGTVDFGGVRREACLDFTPEAQVDQYVVVHVGFAISVLSEQQAEETLALLREIVDLEQELGPEAQELGPEAQALRPEAQALRPEAV